ncbi:Hsp20 family protein [Chitinimonas arctica]|uniref:Hsp20 family protein n=1 Tax=Chitinimonas arctica TaxID=2594795 RepID=A0A516SHY5_9NEIS|nr:Hsp20 family protein [Chitinimonas arctica]QDQ27750.1 Hsp20 family protein [Chitinimonas arctica]
MTAYDFTPVYRTAIGYDRLVQMIDDAMRRDTQSSYPPYNIEVLADDKYKITMAVAGFDRAELDIEVEQNTLKVVGRKAHRDTEPNYLHRGIAARNFEQIFHLDDHVKVEVAGLNNGLLTIELKREIPEALKPRKILIDAADNVHTLERRAA